MNTFIGIAALLTLLALAWFVRPLLRKNFAQGVSSQRLNAAIHRDQLAALEADLARGAISQQDFEATRDELQLRLLDDTANADVRLSAPSAGFWTGRRTAVLVAIVVPLVAVPTYLKLGSPASIDPVATAQGTHEQMQQMIDTLAARLKANPDPKGWVMLARSYKMMNRFAEARDAFDKAHDLVNTEPDLLVDYADVLAVLANNNLEGQPMEMVKKALALNPQHPMGLMMSGVAAYRRSDFKQAVVQWEKLLAELEPGSADAQQVEDNIADARSKAGMPATSRSSSAATPSNKMPPIPDGAGAGMTPEMINQMVDRLAARLKDKPNDPAGWAQLARAYKVQGRNAEAEQAYGKTGKLLESDADLITQYVDLIVTRTKGDFKGKPTELINKALALNPKHPTALMMAGQAAYQAGNYAKAIGHWETVLSVLPPGSPDIAAVQNEIADAKTRMGKK